MKALLGAALIGLGACRADAPPPSVNSAAPVGLEAAAIEAGIIPDPATDDIAGLYTRDTDQVCVVPSTTAYRIGVVIDYGDEQHCSGSGTATRAGEMVRVAFPQADGCAFDARFEGDRIVFPGRLPDACQRLCSRRASMAALDVSQLSASLSEAATLRDTKGRLLCSSAG